MKAFPRVSVLLALLSAHFAMAAPEVPDPIPPEQRPPPAWTVRVEVLMIAMPQAMFLKQLPDLHNPARIDSAVDQLLAATQRKEAILTGYPMVNMVEGDRSVTEMILEKRFPTDLEPPKVPQNATAGTTVAPHSLLVDSDIALSASFETRNTGVTLEVEAEVQSGGESIMVNVVPQRVELLGFDAYDAARNAAGNTMKIGQPQFLVSKTTTRVSVKNGQRTLIAVNPLPKPEDYVEVFVLQAVASPIGKGKEPRTPRPKETN
jgi:hypothetical protein